jgi:hypothetical protein
VECWVTAEGEEDLVEPDRAARIYSSAPPIVIPDPPFWWIIEVGRYLGDVALERRGSAGGRARYEGHGEVPLARAKAASKVYAVHWHTRSRSNDCLCLVIGGALTP